jgi:hypothetical protein
VDGIETGRVVVRARVDRLGARHSRPHVVLFPAVHHPARRTLRLGCQINRSWGIPLPARGATPSAFERRCIPPPPQRGCRVRDPGVGVAPPSNTPGILGRRALPGPGALSSPGALGATMDLHHGLLRLPLHTHKRPKSSVRSSKSINSPYGNPFSPSSVTNPYATSPSRPFQPTVP